MDGLNQPFLGEWQPPKDFNIFEGTPPAVMVHVYVPPVEDGSAYARQAMAPPGDVAGVADENPSHSSSARPFLAINDRLDDESVDYAAFGSPSIPREAAGFIEEDADEMHPMDDDNEPLSAPRHEVEENAIAPLPSTQTTTMMRFWHSSLLTANRCL